MKPLVFSICLLALFTSCQNKWDKHHLDTLRELRKVDTTVSTPPSQIKRIHSNDTTEFELTPEMDWVINKYPKSIEKGDSMKKEYINKVIKKVDERKKYYGY